MKIILVFVSFFLIQIFCQETVTTVDREVCIKAGIPEDSLPETVPVPVPVTGNCHSAILDSSTTNISFKISYDIL